LGEGEAVVEGGDGEVAAVDYGGAAGEGVEALTIIIITTLDDRSVRYLGVAPMETGERREESYVNAPAAEPLRMPFGPNLVPVLYDVAVSKGRPTIRMSSAGPDSLRQSTLGSFRNVSIPANAYVPTGSRLYFSDSASTSRVRVTWADWGVGAASTEVKKVSMARTVRRAVMMMERSREGRDY